MHNLNESAGGSAGLATLIWLAPLAVVTRGRSPRVAYLTGIVVFGAMAAFRLPPVDNLLRCLPVLDVMDNRRLTLWVAFGLTMLGGIGLDQLVQTRRLYALLGLHSGLWRATSSGSLAVAIRHFEPDLRERAIAHYRHAASSTEGADPTVYQQRAERQVRQALDFLPRHDALITIEIGVLAALAARLSRAHARSYLPDSTGRFLGLDTLGSQRLFGIGLNPAISRELHRFEPPVIKPRQALLGCRPEAGPSGWVKSCSPNVLMQFSDFPTRRQL